jgi:hypothetical protein
MAMMGKQDREGILDGMRALKRLCLKIEKESIHSQSVVLHHRTLHVTWMLGFDDSLLAFEASVNVIPVDSTGSKTDKVCVDLGDYIQARLDGLREHDPWPDAIPFAWMEDASRLIHLPETPSTTIDT